MRSARLVVPSIFFGTFVAMPAVAQAPPPSAPSELAATLEAVRAEAAKHPASHPLLFATSAETGEGIAELRTAIVEAVEG